MTASAGQEHSGDSAPSLLASASSLEHENGKKGS